MDDASGSAILSAIQEQQHVTAPLKEILEDQFQQHYKQQESDFFNDFNPPSNSPQNSSQQMELNGSPLPNQFVESDESCDSSESGGLIIDQGNNDRETAPASETPPNKYDESSQEMQRNEENSNSGRRLFINPLKRKLSQDDLQFHASKFRKNVDENGIPDEYLHKSNKQEDTVATTTISFNNTFPYKEALGKLFKDGEGHLKEYAQYLGLQPTVKFKCFKCAESRFKSFAKLKEHQVVCLRTPLQAAAVSSPKSIGSGDAGSSSTGKLKRSDTKEDPSAKIRITRKVFLCSTCGTYYEKWNLFLHMREVHKKHICLFCVGLFHSAERLIHHLETKHAQAPNHFETKEDLLRSSRHSFYVMCCRCEHVFDDSDNFTSHHCDKYLQPCSLCGLKLGHKQNCKASVTGLKRTIGGSGLKDKKSKKNSSAAAIAATATSASVMSTAKNNKSVTLQNYDQGKSVTPATFDSRPNTSMAAMNGYIEHTPDHLDNYTDTQLFRGGNEIADNNSRSQHDSNESTHKKAMSSVTIDPAYFNSFSQEFAPAAVAPSDPQSSRINGDVLPETNERRDNSLDELSSNEEEEEDDEEEEEEEEDDDDEDDREEHVQPNESTQRLLVPKLKLSIPKEYQSTPIESEEENEEDEDEDEESSSAASSESSEEDDDGAEQSHGNVELNNSEENQDEEQHFNDPGDSPNINESQHDDNNINDNNTTQNVDNTPQALDAEDSVPIKEEEDVDVTEISNNVQTNESEAPDLLNSNATETELNIPATVIDPPLVKEEEHTNNAQEVHENDESLDQPMDISQELEETALVPSDGIEVAGEDIPVIALTLKQALDKIPIRDFLRICLGATFPFCLYCNHARRIAVNGKALALHLIGQHRFYATVDSITEEELHPPTIVARLKSTLDEVDQSYFNMDTYDNGDPERDDRPTLGLYEKTYECFQCRFGTRVHKELYLHNRKMHLKAVIICLMCRLSFYSYSELLCHMCPGISNAIGILDLTFRCVLCDLDQIPSAFRLMVHLRKRHFACDVCLEECHNQAKLSSHVWKHKLHHLCYRCGIAYRNKPDITKHLFWKHGTESVMCKRCLQKKWPHVYHFCVPPAVFICEECNLHFNKAVALKVHKRLHNSNAPYPCTEDDCEKRFISRKLLLRHVDRHQNMPLLQIKDEPITEEIKQEAMEEIEADEAKENVLSSSEIKDENVPEKVKKVKRKKSKKSSAANSKSLLEMLDLSAPNLSESDSSDESDSETKVNSSDGFKTDVVAKEEDETFDKPSISDNTPEIKVNCNGEQLDEDEVEEKDTTSNVETSASSNPMLDILKNLQNYQESQNLANPKDEAQIKLEEEHEKKLNVPPPMLHVAQSDHDYCLMYRPGKFKILKNEIIVAATSVENDEQEDIENKEENKPEVGESEEVVKPEELVKDEEMKKTEEVIPEKIPEVIQEINVEEESPIAVDEKVEEPPPVINIQTPSTNKEHKKVADKKADSSSSDSSTDSDSTTCSCGSNCTCNSSSSNSSSSSSSSSSSDSVSSSSEGKRRKKLKSIKELKHVAHKNVLPVKPLPPIVVTPQENVDPDDIIFESDLETDESLTDEDFYDDHPQKLASEMLAEKRKQLLMQTCINPTDNYDIIENSRPSTPSLPEQEFVKEKKVKLKKKKKERKKNNANHHLTLSVPKPSPLEQLFQEQEAYNNANNPTSASSHDSNTIKLLLSDSSHPIIKPTDAISAPHLVSRHTSSAGSNSDASASASDGPLKRSKRRRIPNKFYGYSSDEEGHHHNSHHQPPVIGAAAFKPIPPPNLTWRKEDLPQPSNVKTPPIKSVIKLPPKSHIPLSPLLPPIPPLVIKPILAMPEIVPPKVEPLRVPSVPVHHINPSVTPIGSAATSPKSQDSDSSEEGTLHIQHPPPPPQIIHRTPKQASRKKRRSSVKAPTTPFPRSNSHKIAATPPPSTSAMVAPTPPSVAAAAAVTHAPHTFQATLPLPPVPRVNHLNSSYFAPAGTIQAPPQTHQPPYLTNAGALPRMPASFANRPAREGKSVYCYCRCPYDEVSDMIACDDDNCDIEWFHFDCVGIIMAPKGRWFCPSCRERNADQMNSVVESNSFANIN